MNRYGKPEYKNWRYLVHMHGIAGAVWTGCLISSACSVFVRYYQHLDRRKDVDNILKAILDGLDGKIGLGHPPTLRVLVDDRHVEHVVSRRTKLGFSARLDGRRLSSKEYAAALAALSGQAAVYVAVGEAPDHRRSVCL